ARREPRRDGGAQEVARDARIAGDHGLRATSLGAARLCRTPLAQDDSSRLGQGESKVGSEGAIGEPSHTIRAEKSHRGLDQRFENCEALRAFLRPAFLLSMMRASRVRKPAFLRAGRLFSRSISLSAREIARRSAPAWPEGPPPLMRAITLYAPVRPSSVKGSVMSCWCSLLGKYSASSRPLTVNEPSPGIRRARAIACLRRPTAAPGTLTTGRSATTSTSAGVSVV